MVHGDEGKERKDKEDVFLCWVKVFVSSERLGVGVLLLKKKRTGGLWLEMFSERLPSPEVGWISVVLEVSSNSVGVVLGF